MLEGRSPVEVAKQLGSNPNWRVETLGKGSHAGQGWVYRHYGPRGPTGLQIRWHPGGGRHGPSPYWRVNAGHGQSEPIPGGE